MADEPLQRPEASAAPGNGLVPGRGTHALIRSLAKLRATWGVRALAAGASALRVTPLRRAVAAAIERRLRLGAARAAHHTRHPPAVEADALALKLAFLRLADRALGERRVAGASLRGLIKVLFHDVLIGQGEPSAKRRFRARFGCGPPSFLVLSPGHACNLKCVGCYANSGPSKEKLSWATLDRVVAEAHDSWGIRFFVLSGGEPLAYRDEGKGVLDLAARHQDCFFIMYTNGTLIDDRVAARLAELGNLSPSLSVEGLRERTDARRGAGVFDAVLDAQRRLRRRKVLFGLSLTATRDNVTEILNDEMVDLFFGEMGALYAWVFHYLPIGRAFTLDLMATAEQRVRLWQREWELVRARRHFIVDFWNSATTSEGCIAGGRPGGYLHVDWNGNVTPCVFIPYSPVNLNAAYARNATLDDIWQEPFFAAIRDWQRTYGYRETGEACARECGNWLTPCLYRDHHEVYQRLAGAHGPRPVDADAAAALIDPAYHDGLVAFGRDVAALTDPLWSGRYANHKAPGPRRPVQ